MNAFETVDALLTPVAPTPAFALGEKVNDPLQMYLSDIYTIPVNLAGTCAMSLPCGFSTDERPIGLQLIGSKGIVNIRCDKDPLAHFIPGNPFNRAIEPLLAGPTKPTTFLLTNICQIYRNPAKA